MTATDGNLAVIEDMWERYERDGLAAITGVASDDAVWRPHSAEGRTFRSTEEYRAYVEQSTSSGVRVESRLLGTWAHEDIVVTRGRLRVRRGGRVVEDTRMFWIHRLRDGKVVYTASSPDLGRLLEDAGYPDDRLAVRAFAALSGSARRSS